jgi:hypothetical protein
MSKACCLALAFMGTLMRYRSAVWKANALTSWPVAVSWLGCYGGPQQQEVFMAETAFQGFTTGNLTIFQENQYLKRLVPIS